MKRSIRVLIAAVVCAVIAAGMTIALAGAPTNQGETPDITTEGAITRFVMKTIEWNRIDGADGYTLHWVMPDETEMEFTGTPEGWATLSVYATSKMGTCRAWVVAHTGDGDVTGPEKEFAIVREAGNGKATIRVNGEEIPDGGTAYVESGKYAEFTFSFSYTNNTTAEVESVSVYDEGKGWISLIPAKNPATWPKWYETPGEIFVAVEAGFIDSQYTTAKAGIRLKVEPDTLRVYAEEEATIGQDVSVTVRGVPEGEAVTVTLEDPDGRIADGAYEISDGNAIAVEMKGYQILESTKNPGEGAWSIRATTKDGTASRSIRMNGTPLQAPTATIEAVTENETGRQAVIGITAPQGADRIKMMQVFYGASGERLGILNSEYPLTDGKVTISTGSNYRESVWAVIISARVNGIWTQAAPAQYIAGSAGDGAPTVTVSTDAGNPGTITVSAPGWNGEGCLIMMTEPQLMDARWSLTFENGIASVAISENHRFKGTNILQAALFEDGRAVAWSEPTQVSYPQGAAHEPDAFYAIEAETAGTKKAGAADAVSLEMSTADGQERFGVDVYNARNELVWKTITDGNQMTFPAYVFNAPGTYEIECYIGDNYLERTLRVSIEENQQPAAPTISNEVVKQNDHSYVSVEAPESGMPDGWYYEIIRANEDWGTPSRSSDPYKSMLIRADMHGSGSYRIRACQIRNGTCGPWGYGEFTYEMDTDGIEVVVPESVTFGQNYTISTPTTIPGGLPVVLCVTDKATGENVYIEVDTLNTRIFAMDGSLLPAGTYTATITAGTTVSGHKDYTIVGSGPEKPTLSADPLLLTGPGTVTFTVNAPGAESVYLSEGGAATESFAVTDGTAEITISFSMYKNGKYEFRARAQANGINSLWSDPVTVEVRTNLPEDNEWSEPTYTWATDRKSVTASRYSFQDTSIREEETVAAARIVIVSPGQQTAGRWQETSDRFINKAFSAQVGEEGVIPALNEMKVLYLPADIETVDQEALAGTDCEAIIVPDGCGEIGEKAFANNAGLIYLRLPASVEEIPASAIEGCPDVLIDWAKK